jgi:hypothetical protein
VPEHVWLRRVCVEQDGQVSATAESMSLDPKRVALAQMMMATLPQLDEATTDTPAADASAAVPLKEPGFVIATTDDSSPPPVTEGTTFHHIKNFAGTEQMMNNGEVAAQGAGADFQNGEVVGAGVHVASGIGSGDGVTVGSGVINGQGVTAGSGEGMGTGMFAGKGEGTGMMVGIGSGVGSGHMITVGDGFVEGKGILENYEGHDMFIVSGSGSGTGISVTDGYGSGTMLNVGNGQGSGTNVVVGDGHVSGLDIAGDNGELSGTDLTGGHGEGSGRTSPRCICSLFLGLVHTRGPLALGLQRWFSLCIVWSLLPCGLGRGAGDDAECLGCMTC